MTQHIADDVDWRRRGDLRVVDFSRRRSARPAPFPDRPARCSAPCRSLPRRAVRHSPLSRSAACEARGASGFEQRSCPRTPARLLRSGGKLLCGPPHPLEVGKSARSCRVRRRAECRRADDRRDEAPPPQEGGDRAHARHHDPRRPGGAPRSSATAGAIRPVCVASVATCLDDRFHGRPPLRGR